MPPNELLSVCARTNHDERMRVLAQLPRSPATTDYMEADSSDSFPDTLAALLASDSAYENMLGLQASFGTRDVGPALELLGSSPSRMLRRRAVRVLARLGDNKEVLAGLTQVREEAWMVMGFVKVLRRLGKVPALDAFVAGLEDRDLARQVAFYASEETVRKSALAGDYRAVLTEHAWKLMARSYPELVGELLRTWIAEVTGMEGDRNQAVGADRVRRVVVWVLPTLGDTDPDLGVELFRLALGTLPLASLQYAIMRLVESRPREMCAVVLASGQEFDTRFGDVAEELSTEQLLALFEAYNPNTNPFVYGLSSLVFARIAPDQRAAIWDRFGKSWRSTEGDVDQELVAALPTPQRLPEARRHLELQALLTRPLSLLTYAALLPWNEAFSLIHPYLVSPDADSRSAAFGSLADCARYASSHLMDLLKLAIQRRNEQDPVRFRIIESLRRLPPSRWTKEHLPVLEQIGRHALDALDASLNTINTFVRLVGKVIPFHTDWAIGQVVLVYREQGAMLRGFPIDLSSISLPARRQLAQGLAPVVMDWVESGKTISLKMMMYGWRRQMKLFPELADAVERWLLEGSVMGQLMYDANTMLEGLRQGAPKRLQKLIPRLLERDLNFFSDQQVVQGFLHRRRQDLLDPTFSDFTFERADKLLDYYSPTGFFRWTPEQQDLLCEYLVAESLIPNTQAYDVRRILTRLSKLCYLSPIEIITPFLTHPEVSVREKALFALSQHDCLREALPTLLSALAEPESARIAIYALSPSLRRLHPATVLGTLKKHLERPDALTKNITVAKEILRILGTLPGGTGAFEYLISLASPTLHRDIHIALLSALTNNPLHLSRPETWSVIHAAAAATDTDLAVAAIELLPEYPPPAVLPQLRSVLRAALARKEIAVRLAALRWLSRSGERIGDDTPPILATAIVRLALSPNGDEADAATLAVVNGYSLSRPEVVEDMFTSLLGQAVHHRDGRRIGVAVEMLRGEEDRVRYRKANEGVLSVLRERSEMVQVRLDIIMRLLPWDRDTEEQLLECIIGDMLHGDALGRAEALVEGWVDRVDIDLPRVEGVLAAMKEEAGRRLALECLKVLGGRKGWTEEMRARLEKYRGDESLLVREAAWWVDVPVQ